MDGEAHGGFEERDARVVVVVRCGADFRIAGGFVVQRDGQMVSAQDAEEVSAGDESVFLKKLAIRARIVGGQESPGFEQHL